MGTEKSRLSNPNSQKVVTMFNKTAADDNETGIDGVGMEIDSAPSNPGPLEPKESNTVNSAASNESECEVFYGCKACEETFPVSDDNKFRKHMLISHAKEFAEDDISVFEECKIVSNEFRRCKRCNQRVINMIEAHQCLPAASLDSAFEITNIVPGDTLHKFECGLCPNRYSARYKLKQHIEQHHQQVAKRAILDPEFRCACCLKRFGNSLELMKHCATCSTKRPRQSTLREIARSAACCDICNKTHGNIEETLICYYKKNYRLCMFCLAIFKSKRLLCLHLHKYHSMRRSSSASKEFKIACPFCTNLTGKITPITHHMATQHLSPMLCTNNPGIPMPLPIQQKQPGVLKMRSVRPGLRKILPAVKMSTQANSNTMVGSGLLHNGGRVPLASFMSDSGVEEKDNVATVAFQDRQASLDNTEAATGAYGISKEKNSRLEGLVDVVDLEAEDENGVRGDSNSNMSSSNIKAPLMKMAPNENPGGKRKSTDSFDTIENHAKDTSNTYSYRCICGTRLSSEVGLNNHISYYRGDQLTSQPA